MATDNINVIPGRSPLTPKMSKIPVPTWRNHYKMNGISKYKEFKMDDLASNIRNSVSNLDLTSDTCSSSESSNCFESLSFGKESRVGMLLNNDLFKKHLAKNAHLINRHGLSSKNFGMRKTVSNIDLSSCGIENFNLSNSVHRSVDFSTGSNNSDFINSLRTSNSANKKHERRKSVTCDRISLDLILTKMDSAASNSVTGTRRVYIPTFSEFRKTKQEIVRDKYGGSSKDNMCFRSLDTIIEDDNMKCKALQLSNLNKSKDNIYKIKPVKSEISEDVTKPKDSVKIARTMGDNSNCLNNDYGKDKVQVFMENVLEQTEELKESATDRISSPVFRSTSDVCSYSKTVEIQRKRRLRKQRQCKSEPLISEHSPQHIQSDVRISLMKPDCEVDDNSHLLRYSLTTSTTSGNVSQSTSLLSLDDLDLSEGEIDHNCESDMHHKKRLSSVSLGSNDSAVIHNLSDASIDNSSPFYASSPALLDPPNNRLSSSSIDSAGVVCSCQSFNTEDPLINTMESSSIHGKELCSDCTRLEALGLRKDIIQEILDTEYNYIRDLNILNEEFCTPMKLAGLLNPEQIEQVFGNLQELIQINSQFYRKLQYTVDISAGNERIGCLFLESRVMFEAFEAYCINQHQALAVLEQMAKEKELLRIFLQVSQNENSALRRMSLKSFLVVPVQRIVRYHLLLSSLYKATPVDHPDRDELKLAKIKLNEVLLDINSKTNCTTFNPKRRRATTIRRPGYSCNVSDKNELQKVALDAVGWNKKEVLDLVCGKVWYGLPPDHTWANKKCRNVKFTQIYAVLLVLAKTNDNGGMERRGTVQEKRNTLHDGRLCLQERRGSLGVLGSKTSVVEQGVMVLLREKNGKYQVLRDPLALDKCVVTVDPDYDEVFEIQEWGRDAYLLKCDDPQDTKLWIKHLKQQTKNLSKWRKRRNALSNIMLKQVV